jgi:hypothetical protein
MHKVVHDDPFFLSICLRAGNCHAQDLAPRAYIITPVHSNAITLTYSFYDGGFQFAGNISITGSTAKVNVPVFSYSHSLNFFSRTANFTASLPYGIGHFRGTVVGAEAFAHRSGLLSPTFRISLNLIGGPAMNADDYRRWRQKTILGASFKLVPLAGQYPPRMTHSPGCLPQDGCLVLKCKPIGLTRIAEPLSQLL